MIIRHMQFECSHFSNNFLSLGELSIERGGGCSILSARSRSIHPKIIAIFSFQSLEFEPLRIGTFLRLADIVVTLVVKKTNLNVQ